MKRVKSDWRGNLNTDTLSELIYISVEGPVTEDYNYMLALERWWQDGQRAKRPHN